MSHPISQHPAPLPAPGAPKILIALLSPNWTGIARLPRALALAGFEVGALCPAQSFLALTRFNHHCFEWSVPGNPLQALNAAVRQFQPDWVLPGCDSAAYLLEAIVHTEAEGRWPPENAHLPALIRRSLGDSATPPKRLSKHDNLAMARALGLTVPAQHVVQNEAQAVAAALQIGWPVVLKADQGSAGITVRICQQESDLRRDFAALAQLVPHQRLAVQAFVAGAIGMCAGVAVAGRLLESVAARKLHTYPKSTSPCSAYEVIEHTGMTDALARMVQAHHFTGFCAIDVILEAGSRTPYLLEFNPRPTPLSASAVLHGHDVCAALFAHLQGLPYQRAPALIPQKTVALFPNEWQRDPGSPHLNQGHHDVPHDDPVLMQALWRSIGVTPPATA